MSLKKSLKECCTIFLKWVKHCLNYNHASDDIIIIIIIITI